MTDAPTETKATTKAKRNDVPHQVTFVGFPKLFFIWPIILEGFLFYFLNDQWALTVGWVYIFSLLLVILTLGVDVDRNQAVFWIVLIALAIVGGMYLEQVKQIPLVGAIFGWFGEFKVNYNRSFGLALSIILVIPWALMFLWAYLNDRWRITHNEFEHYAFGRMDDSLGRGAKSIRTAYPDIFELILGFAGTLIVFNATGTRELRRIHHVMFLPMVRGKLNKILERTAITAGVIDDEEDDEEM